MEPVTGEEIDDFLFHPQKYMTPEQWKDWSGWQDEFEKKSNKLRPEDKSKSGDDDRYWHEWSTLFDTLHKKYKIKTPEQYLRPNDPIDRQPFPEGRGLVKKNRDLEMKILGYA